MYSKANAFLACAALAAMVGCASGKRIEPEQYQKVTEGKTTRSELVALLGEPTSSSFNGSDELLAYNFSKSDLTNYIPVIGMVKHGTQGQMCLFTIDKSSVLKSKSCYNSKV